MDFIWQSKTRISSNRKTRWAKSAEILVKKFQRQEAKNGKIQKFKDFGNMICAWLIKDT